MIEGEPIPISLKDVLIISIAVILATIIYYFTDNTILATAIFLATTAFIAYESAHEVRRKHG